jgi:anaerobic glycerol-3-phosphate dehydrogenase
MTKIRDIARITPLMKVSAVPTPPKRKPGNANNPGFKKWLAERHDQQLNLQDIILVALEELQEPVSTLEVQHYLKTEGDMDIIDYRIKYALDQLVSADKAAVHLETEEERTLRANGVPTTPKSAYLFNSGATPKKRSVAVVVEGYRIFDPRSLKGRPKTPKPAVAASTPASAGTLDHAALDFLIEKIVSERTADIQKKLDEANKKLAALKKLVD